MGRDSPLTETTMEAVAPLVDCHTWVSPITAHDDNMGLEALELSGRDPPARRSTKPLCAVMPRRGPTDRSSGEAGRALGLSIQPPDRLLDVGDREPSQEGDPLHVAGHVPLLEGADAFAGECFGEILEVRAEEDEGLLGDLPRA